MSLSWSNLCRLCINSEESDNLLFNVEGESKGIVELIEKYLSIYITPGDDLPTSVCHLCCEKLTLFNSFATECERAQSFLESHKSIQLQDDFHLPYLKTEFELGENTIKIKYEQNDDETNTTYDNLDHVPLSDLRDIKDKERKNEEKFKKKREKLQKKTQTDLLDSKIFNELILVNSEVIDNSTGILDPSSRLRNCKEIKSEITTYNEDSNAKPVTKSVLKRVEKKLKAKIKRFSAGFSKLPKKIKYSMFKFDCHVCKETLPNFNALQLHTKRTHDTHALALCICSKYLKTRRSLIQHIALHDPSKNEVKSDDNERLVVCHICGLSYRKHLISSHMRTHRTERNFICNECNKSYKIKNLLALHIEAVHSRVAFQCSICTKILNSRTSFSAHKRVHDTRTRHQCSTCGKKFKRSTAFKLHCATHTGVVTPCQLCPSTFSNRQNLNVHMKRYHPKEREEEKARLILPQAREEPLKIIVGNGTFEKDIRSYPRKTEIFDTLPGCENIPGNSEPLLNRTRGRPKVN